MIPLAVGCSERGSYEGKIRLIAEEPEELFEVDRLFTARTVADWGFDGAGALEGWSTERLDEVEQLEAGVRLRSHWQNPRLQAAVAFDTAEVDGFEIETTGLKGGAVAILWSGPGEGFTSERRVTAKARPPFDGLSQKLRLHVRNHPLWQGKVERLMISFAVPRGRPFVLRSLRAVGGGQVPERVRDSVMRPWKLALGEEVRSGWLGWPGHPIVRELTVPPDAILELGWGVPEGMSGPCRFSVSVEPEGGEGRELWSQSAGEASRGHWQEARVPLESLAGHKVRLVFRVEAEKLTPLEGIPSWSNPEVIHRVSGEPPPNILLISVDTLRADRLSLYGSERRTSPELEAWAERRGAAVFLDAVAASPWTLPSHVSMLTGINAHRHGVNHHTAMPPAFTTLAETLWAHGYRTMAITGGGFLHPQFGFSQGFDTYRAWSAESPADEELASGVARAISLLEDSRDQPWFLFFHTYEVHAPYRPRQPFFDQFSDLDPETEVVVDRVSTPQDGGLPKVSRLAIRSPDGEIVPLPPELGSLPEDLYDAGVAFTDQQIGALLRRLEELGIADRTAVVFTSDHGEMLGEHGLAGHAYLEEENLHIPLVVEIPGRSGPLQRISQQVRTIDVLPTLVELAGLDAPSGIDGVSLVDLARGRRTALPRVAWSYAANTNYGISLRVSGRLKYIFNDSAFFPQAGAETFLRRRGVTDRWTEVAVAQTEAAPLRRTVSHALSVEAPGLRVRLVNRGDEPLTGRLAGAPVLPQAVKSPGLEGAAVSFVELGEVKLAVDPGGLLDLLLEAPEPEPLELAIDGGPSNERLSRVIDLATWQGPLVLSLQGGRWTVPAGGRSLGDGVEVTVEWQAGGATARSPKDDAVAEDLRALGYLD